MREVKKETTIAWLAVGDEGYGVARAVLVLAQGIRRLGWRPVIICLDDGEFARECESRGLSVCRLNLGKPPQFSGSIRHLPSRIWRLRRYQRQAVGKIEEVLKRERADAVHVVWSNLVALAGQAAHASGLPCFWEMPNLVSNSYPFGLNRRLYQWTCRRFGIHVLANSAYTAATLAGGGVRPEVVYLSADEAVFDPAVVEPVLRQEVGIPQNAVVLGICGRLTPGKGQEQVLEAMLSLTDSRAPLHLLLLGGPAAGPYSERLREIAKANNASDRLHLAGAVDSPQRWYPMMDIIINNYLGAETFGLSVVEGMMMGRPALVHALGGPAETVIDGQTGWHISAPTPEAVRQGLMRALDERDRWATMGEAARRHSLTNFSTAVQIRKYQEVVQNRVRH